MSALAVVFHPDRRPVDPTAVWAMLAAVPYRGLDGSWIRDWDGLSLGFAKTTVTPEEVGEQQPLVSRRTGCAIAADARLDNRDDLLAKLGERAHPGCSDAELILRAYEKWALDLAKHLLGDFAFVIWDPRHRRLVCARDTGAQRSLFYRFDNGTFAAASEIHQLLQDPAVPVVPNEERIRDFLVPWNVIRNEKDRPDTFYEGISAIPAGQLLVVDPSGLELRKYWGFEPPQPIRYRTDSEYAEHYRALFFDVVGARLRNIHPIGVMLSGGLDSASVACVAQELYQAGRAVDRGFATFTSVFDGLECDERPFVADVQAKYGLAAHLVPADNLTGPLELEPVGFQESPNGGGAAQMRNPVFAAAEQAGVRTLLTGDIADACVYGSRMVFDSLLRQGQLRSFWYHLQSARRTSRAATRTIVGLSCVAPLLPLPVQRSLMIAYVQRLHRRHGDAVLPRWMSENLRADLSRRNLALYVDAERRRRFSNPTHEEEYRLLWPPEAARHPAPWPFEIWRPYADRRLHAFLLAIPPEQKFHPHPETDEFYAGSKWLVRRALQGVLPESIRTRTSKTVFSAAFEREMAAQWVVAERVFGTSKTTEVAARGYIDQARFSRRVQELRRGMHDAPDLIYVSHMLGLEAWLRALALPRPQRVTVPDRIPVNDLLQTRLHQAGENESIVVTAPGGAGRPAVNLRRERGW